jgi:hypothetical protein
MLCFSICSLERGRGRFRETTSLALPRGWTPTPKSPKGKWFKRFPGLIACGEGELVKTSLIPGQVPHGEEVV